MTGATSLHAESRGQGPPIVCWHGWGMNLRCFDALRDALGASARIIAVDLPGHGHSRWERDAGWTLPRLLATLPPPGLASAGVTLVGWSLGAQLALRAAAAAPGRIARLLLFGATPRFVNGGDWRHGFDAQLLRRMRSRLASDAQGAVSDFIELQLRGSRDAASAARTLRAALLEHGAAQPEALQAGLTQLADTDLRAQLASIRTPALVIAGQHDPITPPAASAVLAAALPQAQYLELRRAAHAPFLTHLAELLPRLRAFLGIAVAA